MKETIREVLEEKMSTLTEYKRIHARYKEDMEKLKKEIACLELVLNEYEETEE